MCAAAAAIAHPRSLPDPRLPPLAGAELKVLLQGDDADRFFGVRATNLNVMEQARHRPLHARTAPALRPQPLRSAAYALPPQSAKLDVRASRRRVCVRFVIEVCS